ncbi:MAG: hypothetical protein AW09_000578 [Candidatus Accumulibacter phosphatis]|uniref:Uncharacterized protein n=1 Tax=Candidatus Accumulibacter phosphatis TaxID=327160 RepID=A0A080LZA2_9PROT|nr:MAG: hypothetical protein AW09_000578 [Candidatus Accumulibacter phosphatis]
MAFRLPVTRRDVFVMLAHDERIRRNQHPAEMRISIDGDGVCTLPNIYFAVETTRGTPSEISENQLDPAFMFRMVKRTVVAGVKPDRQLAPSFVVFVEK